MQTYCKSKSFGIKHSITATKRKETLLETRALIREPKKKIRARLLLVVVKNRLVKAKKCFEQQKRLFMRLILARLLPDFACGYGIGPDLVLGRAKNML